MPKQAVKLMGFALAVGLVGLALPVGAFAVYQLFFEPEPFVSQTPITTSQLTQSSDSSQSIGESSTTQATSNSTVRLEVNITDRQVTFYEGDSRIKTYPIAVGRAGWETPTGNFEVAQMFQNPTWIHPFTDQVIPPGDPQNPLGPYWIGFWTDGKNWIGFHGTPNPETVGTATSHGCIRMYNQDIEELFYKISPGTLVTVVR